MNDLRGPHDREPPDVPDAPPDTHEDRRSIRETYVDDPDDIFRDGEPSEAAGEPDGDREPDTATATATDTDTDTDTDTSTDSGPSTDSGTADPLDRELSQLEHDHPEVGSVVRKLAADNHRLDLTRALEDPRRRDDTMETVRELARGRLSGGGEGLQEYREAHPGQGPLFEQVPREVNRTVDGVSRKDVYLARCEDADPARRIGGLPDRSEREALEKYAERLTDEVEPVVAKEIEDLAATLPGAQVSMRVKDADAILDKVRRMTFGSDARPPRDDYRVGDVVDAVGARITVPDTGQLAELLGSVRERFGTGDGGRVLELDNMYAAPKANNPSYRVIPVLVAVDAGGVPYTYELQLTTRRASVAADLEHNTIYKPYVDSTDGERDAVRGMLAEAAALDQDETRRTQ